MYNGGIIKLAWHWKWIPSAKRVSIFGLTIMKKCTKCKEISNNFPQRKKTKDGLDSWCRKCICKSAKKYSKTKEGLITKIYYSQRYHSKQRNNQMPTYTKQELKEWLFSQKKFHKLYDNWKASGYDKMEVPSVDRIDDYKGYSLDNIQLMTWGENKQKGHSDMVNGINRKVLTPVIQYDLNGNFIDEHYSIAEAGRKTKINTSNISSCLNGKYKTAGGFIWRLKT